MAQNRKTQRKFRKNKSVRTKQGKIRKHNKSVRTKKRKIGGGYEGVKRLTQWEEDEKLYKQYKGLLSRLMRSKTKPFYKPQQYFKTGKWKWGYVWEIDYKWETGRKKEFLVARYKGEHWRQEEYLKMKNDKLQADALKGAWWHPDEVRWLGRREIRLRDEDEIQEIQYTMHGWDAIPWGYGLYNNAEENDRMADEIEVNYPVKWYMTTPNITNPLKLNKAIPICSVCPCKHSLFKKNYTSGDLVCIIKELVKYIVRMNHIKKVLEHDATFEDKLGQQHQISDSQKEILRFELLRISKEALRKEDICRNVPEQVREELKELLGVNFDTHLIEEVKKAEEDDEKYYSDRIDWYKYVTGREEYKAGDEYELRNKEEK